MLHTPGYFPPTSIPGNCCLPEMLELDSFRQKTPYQEELSASIVSWLLRHRLRRKMCMGSSWFAGSVRCTLPKFTD